MIWKSWIPVHILLEATNTIGCISYCLFIFFFRNSYTPFSEYYYNKPGKFHKFQTSLTYVCIYAPIYTRFKVGYGMPSNYFLASNA